MYTIKKKATIYSPFKGGVTDSGSDGSSHDSTPLFFVRFIHNDDAYTCEKSFEDINNAIDSGKICIGYEYDANSEVIIGGAYNIKEIMSDYITFNRIWIQHFVEDEADEMINEDSITINSDNTCLYEDYGITTKSS